MDRGEYKLPFVFVTIDELQEYFTALEKDERDAVINDLCRIARRGPAAGFICNFASQRPDAESVPAKLREIITLRYSTQVVDRTSSDMVLGKGKAAQGADASVLSEEHKGVGVLVTGPASFVTVKADLLDGPGFAAICARGRALRQAVGQLSGDAVGDVSSLADEQQVQIPAIVTDVLHVLRHSTRMFTTDLLAGLVNLDEDLSATGTPSASVDNSPSVYCDDETGNHLLQGWKVTDPARRARASRGPCRACAA